MKIKPCIKRSLRLIEIGIKKATSYKVVKHRLGTRFYNDEFLQARLKD
jgi:hypothetical protein